MTNKEVELLQIGDKVNYAMSYNGVNKPYPALVIDTDPLTLSLRFKDGYRHTSEPDESQYIHISK